jgi:excisionase family DNA binding protein
MDDFLTTKQWADMMGIHYQTAWKRLERCEMPAERFNGTWLIRKADAERYKMAFDILDELREKAEAMKVRHS